MRLRGSVTPIVLVVLALGTVAYATLVDREHLSDADREARRARVFPGLRAQDVRRVRLEHGAKSVAIERSADGQSGARWEITGPRREPADGSAVDVLLRELESANRVRVVDASPTLALGLESPRARGVIDVGPRTVVFALGGDALKPRDGAYLRVDGEGTFVVDGALKEALLLGEDAYRDRTLVPYGPGELDRIEVHAATGATTVLARVGATMRLGDAGGGLRVSRAAADGLLSALSDARVETFLDDAVADAAAKPPAFAVTITPRDRTRPGVELRIGGPCPDAPETVIVIRAAPSRVSACVARRLVDVLSTAPLAPDRSPFFAHADEMEEVRLEPVGAAGAVVDIARRGAGWHERAPEDRDLVPDESEAAGALVAALAGAGASSVRSLSADEPFEPRSRVVIVRTGTRTSEAIELAALAPDGTVVARRVDDGAVLSLPRDVARRFEPHPVALRALPVWRPPFDAASVVGFDDTCGSSRRTVAPVEPRSTLSGKGPRGLDADAVAPADITHVVAHARAEAWIAERDDGGFGFDAPGACAVHIELAGAGADEPPRIVTLSFGAPGDGGVYARAGDDPAVFVAPTELWQTFRQRGSQRFR